MVYCFFTCLCSSEMASLCLFFVALLFHAGRDSRYSEEAPLSVLFVVEWNLIWAISLVAEKQLFRVLSSNVVLSVCACESCFW